MKEYNRLVWLHDMVIGLIPKPYGDYPINYTGLLHQADRVLIFDHDKYHRAKSWEYRKLAISHMTKEQP